MALVLPSRRKPSIFPPSIWMWVLFQFCETPRPGWHVLSAWNTGNGVPSGSTLLFVGTPWRMR